MGRKSGSEVRAVFLTIEDLRGRLVPIEGDVCLGKGLEEGPGVGWRGLSPCAGEPKETGSFIENARVRVIGPSGKSAAGSLKVKAPGAASDETREGGREPAGV